MPAKEAKHVLALFVPFSYYQNVVGRLTGFGNSGFGKKNNRLDVLVRELFSQMRLWYHCALLTFARWLFHRAVNSLDVSLHRDPKTVFIASGSPAYIYDISFFSLAPCFLWFDDWTCPRSGPAGADWRRQSATNSRHVLVDRSLHYRRCPLILLPCRRTPAGTPRCRRSRLLSSFGDDSEQWAIRRRSADRRSVNKAPARHTLSLRRRLCCCNRCCCWWWWCVMTSSVVAHWYSFLLENLRLLFDALQ